MFNRLITVTALAALSALGAGCSNGGSGAASNSYGTCVASSGSDTSFCLVSCSLGCAVGSCSVTDIAANQPIKLVFSHEVDPASVDFNTVSIKTASGRAPEGRLDVSANVVEFVPEVKVIGGLTTFGFATGETYVLTLPDAAESGLVLKSVSGDGLNTSLTCSLSVTQGIVDLDRAPPKATLVSPVITGAGVPADAVITLEFSEIIDIAGFQGSTTHTSPVKYEIRKTMADPNDPTRRICNPNSSSKVIEGLPQAENIAGRNVTIVTLRPAVPLPSQVCVQVTVTNQVHDLAGTPAEPQVFQFTTKVLVAGEARIEETFVSDKQLDTKVSAGIWGAGKALPPQIGGTGILGSFNAAAGKLSTSGLPNHWVWNTDSQLIDGKFTSTGLPIIVAGGVFEFSDFFLPADFILEFTGANMAQIRVRGNCRVDGKIIVSSPAAPYFMAVPNAATGPIATGQPAAAGGAGGGAGGAGGDGSRNKGASAAFTGKSGSDVNLPSGNGYASLAVGTGGKGAPYFPATGTTSVYCALNSQFSSHTGHGGAGGGFDKPGSVGVISRNPCNQSQYSGKPPVTNIAFPLGTLAPKVSGKDASLLHYTVGGSGGGGGGSHALISRKDSPNWCPGSSGGGGGGVLAIRVGQEFLMSIGSSIESKGGAGYFIDCLNRKGESNDSLFNVPTPGGGGSGGSILVQAVKSVAMNGTIDTSGGAAGQLDNVGVRQPGLLCQVDAGKGSNGYFRIETLAGVTAARAGTTIPSASAGNVGKLTDFELAGVSQSKFYSTRLTFPPSFLRYEVECMIDGKRVLYSDDANHKDPDFKGLATVIEPVRFRVQGAEVSPVTGLPVGDPTPWRDAVFSASAQSLNDDAATGFRFSLGFTRASPSQVIEVLRVTVVFVE